REESHSRIVVDGVGKNGPNEGAVIDNLRQVWQQLRDVHAAASVFLELVGRADAEKVLLRAGHGGDALAAANAVREIFAGHLGELRLGVEEVELRRRTRHK